MREFSSYVNLNRLDSFCADLGHKIFDRFISSFLVSIYGVPVHSPDLQLKLTSVALCQSLVRLVRAIDMCVIFSVPT